MTTPSSSGNTPAKREKTERVMVHFCADPEATFESIRQEHLDRGLPEIGFHFVIDAEGRLLLGRHQSRVGVHYEEYDAVSLGVLILAERRSMSEEQELALILLMDKLRADFPEVEKINYVYREPSGQDEA